MPEPKVKLPPGATLVDDGVAPSSIKLPPGATLDSASSDSVDSSGKSSNSFHNIFSWQDKADAKIADFTRRRSPSEIETDLPGALGKFDQQTESSAQNIGRRALGSVVNMVVHPVKSVIGTYETGKELMLGAGHAGAGNPSYFLSEEDKGPIADRVRGFKQEYSRSPREAIENLSGDMLGMYAAGKLTDAAGEPLKPIAKMVKKYAAEKLARGMVNRLIRPMAADVKFGKDPAQGVLEEGITGNPLDDIGDKVSSKLREVGKQLDVQASLPQNAGKIVDASNALKVIDTAMVDAQSSGNIALWDKLKTLKEQLSYNWKPFRTKTGEWVLRKTTPRNLKMNPKDALAFKRAVGDRVRWTTEPLQPEINQVAGQVYGVLKDDVNQAVPGLKELNERYSNLVGAAKAIQRRIPIEDRNAQWSLSDIAIGASGHIPMAIARKAAASAPVTTRVASGLYKWGKKPMAPPSASPSVKGAATGVGSVLSQPEKDNPGPQSSVAKPKELLDKAKQLNPAAQGQNDYAHVAVNPQTGHRVGSPDGQNWYDLQTGARMA